jgi:hypothetical protein
VDTSAPSSSPADARVDTHPRPARPPRTIADVVVFAPGIFANLRTETAFLLTPEHLAVIGAMRAVIVVVAIMFVRMSIELAWSCAR